MPRYSQEMSSMEIVSKLVVGSEAIDRMEREINSVVSTILGLVHKRHEREFWHGKFSKSFDIQTFWSRDFPDCKWYFVRNHDRQPNPGEPYFEAECSLNIGLGEARFKRDHGKFDISHRHIQRVHKSLPVFIDGMRKLFPFLENDWQPFLDAADAK